jgi:hypothetical protein
MLMRTLPLPVVNLTFIVPIVHIAVRITVITSPTKRAPRPFRVDSYNGPPRRRERKPAAAPYSVAEAAAVAVVGGRDDVGEGEHCELVPDAEGALGA